MFSNLLIGVDGQAGGRDAIALASRLVGEGGTLTVAHVFDGHRASSRVIEAAELAGGVVEKARLEADIAADVRFIHSSSVGRGLHELAEDVGADLIVVGSSRHGQRGRVLLPDHTLDALDAAPCAVAVAPHGYCESSAPIETIGIGYDGSPESRQALLVARALAAESGASLAALDVVHLQAYEGAVYADGDLVDELVERAHGEVAALGGVQAHAVYGDSAEELGRFGASVDLLIVGSRGYGPLGRLIHGSTSRRLLHMARCPVLVLTRAAQEAVAEQPDALMATRS